MSKRAEEAALKAYPKEIMDKNGIVIDIGHPQWIRDYYIQGYEKAEQDLALKWKDVAILITIYEQEIAAGNISRYEDEGAPSIKDASEIILRRFNEIRKK